jgi:phospholipid N-methyltransferase
MKLLVVVLAVCLGILSQIDLRWLEDLSNVTRPSQSAVTRFYDQFGGILMNDLYHHLFEFEGMKEMIAHCDIQRGDTIVEIGPGSGFLADHILMELKKMPTTEKPSSYYGIDVSRTMHKKASQRVAYHFKDFENLSEKNKIDAQMILVTDSLEFLANNISFPVDRFVLTYVMDLMPVDVLHEFVDLFGSKLRDSSSKICVVNLTYGFTPLSRIVTNVWQILYRLLGGDVVGGCRPLNILDFFSQEKGFQITHASLVVSTGVPSEVAIIKRS